MQRGLQKVTLSWVFAVKQLKQLRVRCKGPRRWVKSAYLQDKALVDVLLPDVRVELRALDESEEELINDLQVRPSQLKHRLIFLWIKRVARWIDLGRD